MHFQDYGHFHDSQRANKMLVAVVLMMAQQRSAVTAVPDADSPTCATNGSACPLPRWPVTYNLTESTIMYVFNCDNRHPAIQCDKLLYNQSGQPWGLIGIDWQISAGIWSQGGWPNAYPGEQTMIDNCKQIKQLGQATRCMIYQNLEAALQWHESNRAFMNDPTRAEWFVAWHDAHNKSNGTIYDGSYGGCAPCWNDGKFPWGGGCAPDLSKIHEKYPGSRCFGATYFWNFTSSAAQDAVLQSFVGVVESAGEFVDGLFTGTSSLIARTIRPPFPVCSVCYRLLCGGIQTTLAGSPTSTKASKKCSTSAEITRRVT